MWKPVAMSRMLPGRPSWPYGNFAGSTSTVWPSLTKVTLNFCVAGVYFVSSMYGFLPPIGAPHKFLTLQFFDALAAHSRLQRFVHADFRQMLRFVIQRVDFLAHELVVGSGNSIAQSLH